VQRTAVATAAMMCTALGPSHVSAVRDALPVLCNLLQYSDAKVVDNACMALLHVADAYAHDASLLAQLQEAGLINQALQLISAHNGGAGGGPQTSVATYFGMIRLLSTCASGSAAIVEQLLKAGVVDTLQQLLANCALLGSAGSASSGGPAIRTPDQLLEVMTLAHELLPAVPDATAMLLLDLPTTPAAAAPAAGSSGAAAGAGSAAGRASARTSTSSSNQKALADFLASDPDLVLNMCQSLLPLTLQVRGLVASLWRWGVVHARAVVWCVCGCGGARWLPSCRGSSDGLAHSPLAHSLPPPFPGPGALLDRDA
jgi:E3 ubiquitin-protein ligase TRIP12